MHCVCERDGDMMNIASRGGKRITLGRLTWRMNKAKEVRPDEIGISCSIDMDRYFVFHAHIFLPFTFLKSKSRPGRCRSPLILSGSGPGSGESVYLLYLLYLWVVI